LTGSPVASGLK